MMSMMKEVIGHLRRQNAPDYEIDGVPKFPLCNEEELRNFETFLSEKSNYNYMVNVLGSSSRTLSRSICITFYFLSQVRYLSVVAGSSTSCITRNILSKVLTDKVAEKYNWAGRAPKAAFKILLLKDLIVGTSFQLSYYNQLCDIDN